MLEESGLASVAAIRKLARWQRYKTSAGLEHLLEGLRKAGLPE